MAADIFSIEKRSEIMSKIRSKNTKAEIIVFRYLRRKKVYFQKHYKRAPGSPDIALPRKKMAVFIDGDFWHGRTLEQLIERRGMDDFWTKKILRNIERDEEQRVVLLANGWSILRVWESDLMRKRTREESLQRIVDFLQL